MVLTEEGKKNKRRRKDQLLDKITIFFGAEMSANVCISLCYMYGEIKEVVLL